MQMQTDVDTLIEIPCFKCLFWDRRRESPPHCNPGECQKLTEWLLRQAENYQQTEETPTLVSTLLGQRENPDHKISLNQKRSH